MNPAGEKHCHNLLNRRLKTILASPIQCAADLQTIELFELSSVVIHVDWKNQKAWTTQLPMIPYKVIDQKDHYLFEASVDKFEIYPLDCLDSPAVVKFFKSADTSEKPFQDHECFTIEPVYRWTYSGGFDKIVDKKRYQVVKHNFINGLYHSKNFTHLLDWDLGTFSFESEKVSSCPSEKQVILLSEDSTRCVLSNTDFKHKNIYITPLLKPSFGGADLLISYYGGTHSQEHNICYLGYSDSTPFYKRFLENKRKIALQHQDVNVHIQSSLQVPSFGKDVSRIRYLTLQSNKQTLPVIEFDWILQTAVMKQVKFNIQIKDDNSCLVLTCPTHRAPDILLYPCLSSRFGFVAKISVLTQATHECNDILVPIWFVLQEKCQRPSIDKWYQTEINTISSMKPQNWKILDEEDIYCPWLPSNINTVITDTFENTVLFIEK